MGGERVVLAVDKSMVAAKMNETLSPQKLAREQFDIYQQYCLQILENVKYAISEMDATALLELVFDQN